MGYWRKCDNVSYYLFFIWFHFFNVSNIIIWNLRKYQNLSLPVWESININPIMSSLKIQKNEIRQKLDICWHCLFWFDLPIRKEEGKFKQGTKMSAKICQKFLYCELTLERMVLKIKKATSENVLAHCVNSGLLTAERIKKNYTRCLSASWTMPNEIRVITK